jgi:hypothetical protein
MIADEEPQLAAPGAPAYTARGAVRYSQPIGEPTPVGEDGAVIEEAALPDASEVPAWRR